MKEEITAIHDKVDGDLKIINAENSPYVYEMKEEYLKDFDLMAAMAKKQQLEETAQKKALYEEQKRKEAEERERWRKEEAERVEMAGKVQKDQKLPDPENEPADIVPQEAIQDQKPLRRKKIVIAITANETQYAYLNEVLMKLKNNAEKVEILEKEEL